MKRAVFVDGVRDICYIGSARVYRGGSWRNDADGCESSFRGNYLDSPSRRDYYLGFRVVLSEVQ